MNFDINNPLTFPRRQVHLDFHTSPDMESVGSRFSKQNFQTALKTGNVSSITVFAKCHHGLCYYPTEVGTVHPGLDFDLMGAQIEAAHEIGVRAPVYITAGYSDLDAKEHPEWVVRRKDGSISAINYNFNALPSDAKPNCSWIEMCLNDGSYAQHIYDITEEICKRYKKIDGLFYDICFNTGVCYCDECKKGMLESGLNPENDADARKYYIDKHIAFVKKCRAILDRYHTDATIFFNGGALIEEGHYHRYFTHYEMEDLPTAWGCYDKMPIKAAFFSNTQKYYLGMTGKFHLDWGEFGGFKCREALRYEIATMATYGAGASIGDHLFHDGEMDMQTYENIGFAYDYLESIEPYCFGGKSTATVGVYLSERQNSNMGLSKILIENQIDFRIIENGNFCEFDTVIFPDKCEISKQELSALKEYIEKGGKVVFAGEALIADGEFLIDCGLKNPQLPTGDGDYIMADNLDGDLPKSPFFAYYPSVRAQEDDAQVFARVYPPCFNRTYRRFCGHKNSPYVKDATTYPAVSKKGNVVYISHPVCLIYDTFGSLYHKRYFMSAFNLLNPKLSLDINIGAQCRCRMIEQPDQKRYCINMTYACPVKRGLAEVVEDITPVYDIPIKVYTDKKVTSVYLPLKDRELTFNCADGVCSFTLDRLECHETVVVKYE